MVDISLAAAIKIARNLVGNYPLDESETPGKIIADGEYARGIIEFIGDTFLGGADGMDADQKRAYLKHLLWPEHFADPTPVYTVSETRDYDDRGTNAFLINKRGEELLALTYVDAIGAIRIDALRAEANRVAALLNAAEGSAS